jgi:hypothetical protein
VREAAIQSFKEIVTFDELTFAVSSAGIAATPLSCKPAVHKRHFEEAFIKVKASVNQKASDISFSIYNGLAMLRMYCIMDGLHFNLIIMRLIMSSRRCNMLVFDLYCCNYIKFI